MSKLKRGMVDPKRSLLWNLWNYRTNDEERVWSTAHHDVWYKVMTIRHLVILLSPVWTIFLLFAVLKITGYAN